MIFCGDRLKELREDKHWSQQKLADDLSLSVKQIQRYEKDDATPTLATARCIAELFDVSLDYLTGLIDMIIPYQREYYMVLPKNTSKEFREALKYQLDLVKSKFGYK